MRISDWSSDVCSSDLVARCHSSPTPCRWQSRSARCWSRKQHPERKPQSCALQGRVHPTALRSEEHTSELQSLMRISYAVFCLKKKTKILTTIVKSHHTTTTLTVHTQTLDQTCYT